MRLTDIWYTAVDKKTGNSFGAKAKVLPGEDIKVEAQKLEDFACSRVNKGDSNATSVSPGQD